MAADIKHEIITDAFDIKREISDTPARQIGHPIVDQQHTDLIHCLRGLARINESADKKRIMKFLETLLKMLKAHFITEESLMVELKIPRDNFSTHRREHNKIISEIEFEIAKINKGFEANLISISRQSYSWVVDHINDYDTPLSAYLIEIAKK